MSGSKKFYISMFSIIAFVCVLFGITFGIKNAHGNVVDPTPDEDPEPGIETSCVFDRDWFEQISGIEISVSEDVKETITKESINYVSFSKTSSGNYLGKTSSGIDVYYTRTTDGKYNVDFVSGNTISAPANCDGLFSGCSNMSGMDFSNFDTSNVTSSNNMFDGCDSFNSVTGSSGYGLGNLPSSTTGSSDFNETISSETATSLGITQDNISKISFLQASDKEYLTTLNSGIVTYYSQTEDGLFELDFVAYKIYAPEDCFALFAGYPNLFSIDFTNFDTSNVTDMSGMFASTCNLHTLDLSSFDTSNVTNMSNMFCFCYGLTDFNLSNFDTSNVTNMGAMFYGCSNESFVILDLSNFNTSNVTDMNRMFDDCRNLMILDISNFDTRNVTDCAEMFTDCEHIDTVKTGENYTLDNLKFIVEFWAQGELCNSQTVLLNHKASYVEAPALEGCYFVGWKDTNADVIYDDLFCEGNLTHDYYIWSNTTFMAVYETNGTFTQFAFNELAKSSSALAINLNKSTIGSMAFLQSSDKEYLTTLKSGIAVYYSASDIDGIYNVDFVADKIYAPQDCSNLFSSLDSKTIDLTNFDTSNVTNMHGMFDNCENLQALNLSNFNTSNVTNMASMFNHCCALTTLNVSSFDTSNVQNMQGMFDNCKNLQALNLSNFNTSNVTNMTSMFNHCCALTTLNVSSFNTSNVIYMSDMFNHCCALITLNVSSFDTSNVIYMRYMFSSCRSLTTLNLSSFNTSNVIDMTCMFQRCSSLVDLDLASFHTEKLKNMSRMFEDCSLLETLDLSNFDTRHFSSNQLRVFNGCKALTITATENFTITPPSGSTIIAPTADVTES